MKSKYLHIQFINMKQFVHVYLYMKTMLLRLLLLLLLTIMVLFVICGFDGMHIVGLGV